jgi:hypothetical protein
LSDPFHQELSVLVAFLSVSFEHLGALKEVVLFSDEVEAGFGGMIARVHEVTAFRRLG